MDLELLKWAGGIAGAALTAYLGSRAERWRAERESKTASVQADDNIWRRTTEIITSLRSENTDLRKQLDASETREYEAHADCEKSKAALRAELEGDLAQARSQVTVLSRVSFDLTLEKDRLGVQLSAANRKLQESGIQPVGRRSTDQQP